MKSREFPSTRWSLIVDGGAAGTPNDPSIDLIARIYRPAMLRWLTRGGRIQRDEAEDLVQSFFADKLHGDLRGLLTSADRTRGRFRSFLATAMRRHVIDWRRNRRSQARAPRGATILPLETLGELEESNGQPPSQVFDRIWAENVVSEAVRLTRQECRKSGRPETWGIFEARVLAPAMDGLPATSHRSLAQQWNLPSAAESSNLLVTAKRMFARNLRAVVAQYADDPTETDREMDDLWAIFTGQNKSSVRK